MIVASYQLSCRRISDKNLFSTKILLLCRRQKDSPSRTETLGIFPGEEGSKIQPWWPKQPHNLGLYRLYNHCSVGTMHNRMNPRIIKLGETLRDHFIGTVDRGDDVSIFLCGGSSPSEKLFRRELGAKVTATKSKYRYSVYYPEDMFVELILGHQRQDLLTLENLLAESVSAVVILLQSPGTFAELGAFSNHQGLKDRLLVVIDPRFQKSQSFINTGPVRHLQKQTKSKVIYHRMQLTDIDSLSKSVIQASRDIGVASPPTNNMTNPIASQGLYLALIMTLDPVPRWAILNLARLLHPSAPALSQAAAETIINSLVNQGNTILVSGNLSITPKGIDTLYTAARTLTRKSQLRGFLSQLRMEALNIMLRGRRKRLWGVAAFA